MTKITTLFFLLTLSTSVLCAPPPFVDIHLHFNWDQKEIISAQEVVKRLKANNIVLATVSSTPTSLALEVSQEGGPWIKAFFSPYLSIKHRNLDLWHLDENVLSEADKGLASGLYSGIGELHLFPGFSALQDNKVLAGLLKLAEKYQVPFLIHSDGSTHQVLSTICQHYPQVKFLWAHAGGRVKPESVDQLMQQCPNVWAEISARDPWRYDTLVDENNQFLPGWRELLIKYQDRFLTGTDPVWNVTNFQRWAQADEGWDHYDQLVEFHRQLLKQLPAEVEEKIRLTNASLFFKETGQTD